MTCPNCSAEEMHIYVFKGKPIDTMVCRRCANMWYVYNGKELMVVEKPLDSER